MQSPRKVKSAAKKPAQKTNVGPTKVHALPLALLSKCRGRYFISLAFSLFTQKRLSFGSEIVYAVLQEIRHMKKRFGIPPPSSPLREVIFIFKNKKVNKFQKWLKPLISLAGTSA